MQPSTSHGARHIVSSRSNATSRGKRVEAAMQTARAGARPFRPNCETALLGAKAAVAVGTANIRRSLVLVPVEDGPGRLHSADRSTSCACVDQTSDDDSFTLQASRQ